MVAALLVNALVLPLPLFVSGAAAFVVLRAFAGLATAAYDPAARGFLVDATPADRQGEAFGLYGAAQMGGLLFGPAIGGVGASIIGDESIVFWLAAVASAAASLVVAVAVREGRRTRVGGGIPAEGVAELSGSPMAVAGGHATEPAGPIGGPTRRTAPGSLRNRLLIAAIVINAGGAFAQGTYEVDLVALPDLARGEPRPRRGDVRDVRDPDPAVLADRRPLVDRRGGLPFIVVGSLMPAIAGIAYTLIRDPRLALPLILVRGDRLRDPVPGALRGRRRRQPDRPLVDRAGAVRCGRDGRLHRRLAHRRPARRARHPATRSGCSSAIDLTTLAIGLAIGLRRSGRCRDPREPPTAGSRRRGRPVVDDSAV